MIPEGMYGNIDRLIELETRKIDLLRQLKKALMLAEMIGVPPKDIKGKMSCAVTSYGTPLYARPWKTEEFIIHLDGEEVFRKRLVDVPQDLWPADILAEYRRHAKRTQKHKE